jgi:kumamolisin
MIHPALPPIHEESTDARHTHSTQVSRSRDLQGGCPRTTADAGPRPLLGRGSGDAFPDDHVLLRAQASRGEGAGRVLCRAAPGSSQYRHFLTVRQISIRYGASSSTRAAFTREISRLGLSARIDPSGVFARVSGTVRQFDRVFKAQITSLLGNDPNEITFSLKPGASLTLPAPLRALVQDVVPTYAHSATPSGHLTAADVAAARAPRRSGKWTRGCKQAKSTGAFSYAQVRNAYGIEMLGSGSGATVAILNVAESLLGQDIAANARCFGYPRLRTRMLRSDGQTSNFGQPTFEPEEDLAAVVRGMAPGLRSLTFAQVWSPPELWFLGASHVLDAPQLPDSFSISYGECERMIRGKGSTSTTRAGANLMDALFVRLGLAGVGTYASSGDSGSTCNGQPYAGIAWPASSPYVAAVGGTRLTLNRANQRTSEVV